MFRALIYCLILAGIVTGAMYLQRFDNRRLINSDQSFSNLYRTQDEYFVSSVPLSKIAVGDVCKWYETTIGDSTRKDSPLAVPGLGVVSVGQLTHALVHELYVQGRYRSEEDVLKIYLSKFTPDVDSWHDCYRVWYFDKATSEARSGRLYTAGQLYNEFCRRMNLLTRRCGYPDNPDRVTTIAKAWKLSKLLSSTKLWVDPGSARKLCIVINGESVAQKEATLRGIAASRSPYALEAYYELGALHYNRGDFQTAIDTWKQLANEESNSLREETLYMLGRAFIELALEGPPQSSNSYLSRAEYWFSKSQTEYPTSYLADDAAGMAARSLFVKGNFTGAYAQYQNACARFPSADLAGYLFLSKLICINEAFGISLGADTVARSTFDPHDVTLALHNPCLVGPGLRRLNTSLKISRGETQYE